MRRPIVSILPHSLSSSLPGPDYKFNRPSYLCSLHLSSTMDPPHFLGNFASPMPLQKEAIGPAKQIAYYSCFQGPTNQYEYQSRSALKIYSPPTVPFSFFNVPNKLAWARECNRLDSLPQQGIEPVLTSCQRAGRVDDLLEADVITRRGVVVECVWFLAFLNSS